MAKVQIQPFLSGLGNVDGLVFDKSGNLYFTVNGLVPLFPGTGDYSGAIYKVTPGGVVSTIASGFLGPLVGLTMDNSGNLFVSVPNLNSIDKITPGGVVSTFVSNVTDLQGL